MCPIAYAQHEPIPSSRKAMTHILIEGCCSLAALSVHTLPALSTHYYNSTQQVVTHIQ